MGFSVSVPFKRAAATALPWRITNPLRRRRVRRVTSSRRFDNAVLREPSISLRATKRVMDVLGSGAGLVILAPLLIGIAAAIKLTSPGPVFFRQKRYGYHNRRFWILKFRTMYVDLGDQRGTRQAQADDPRVTPLGRMLRKTSLDELPQLINVLKGDMSLVGPRPHVPGMLANGMLYEQFIPYYFQRHNMRPGITGLAQVRGFRGVTSRPEAALARVDCDLEYIQNWSLLHDFRIVCSTVVMEFLSGSGH
jgi:lipopolysaccharide/colanic/teichoic acid biosynthesis glycosyltransferase